MKQHSQCPTHPISPTYNVGFTFLFHSLVCLSFIEAMYKHWLIMWLSYPLGRGLLWILSLFYVYYLFLLIINGSFVILLVLCIGIMHIRCIMPVNFIILSCSFKRLLGHVSVLILLL